MELPSAYVYGGTKRKRSQGDCLRSALESHVREQLNMASLKAQDKKLMAWTLGELAFFAYTSAIEQQDYAGLPAAQAVHNTDFYEAASFIASERGVLDQTPDPVLRRVSANMATRFWESRLPEALESFIELHAPAQRNVVPRAAQAPPAQPQRRNPPAAPRGHAATAAGTAPTVPAQQLNAFPRTGAGPSSSQPGPAERNAQPPPPPSHTAPAGGWRPMVRSHGTQTWAPPAAPTTRPPPEAQPKQELKEDQGMGPLGPIQIASAAAPSRRPEGRLAPGAAAAAAPEFPTCARAAAGPRDYPRRFPAESQAPPAVAGEARLGSDTTAAAGQGGGAAAAGRGCGGMEAFAPTGAAVGDDGDHGGRDEEENLLYTQRSGAPKYNREALRQQLLRPPLLGRSLPGHAHPPCQGRDAWPTQPQQQLQQQQQQPEHRVHEQFHAGHPHGRSGFGSPSEGTDAGGLQQQQQRSAACQTTPSSRDATATAAAAAAHRAAWSEPTERERVQQPDSRAPEKQQQQQQETRHQQPLRERHHLQPHAGRQAAAEQWEQQERGGRAAQPPPPPAQQQEQQEQQLKEDAVRASALLSGRIPLARQAAAPTEAQPEPSSAAAASGGGGDPGPSGTGAPGRSVAGGRNVARVQRGTGADGRAASGTRGGATAAGPGPSAAAVAGGGEALAEPPWEQLRREYEKRLEADALEKRLRKHLRRKGNSMIKKYCHKERMPWTLLDVACYGVALQKLSSKPFDAESAVRFLARVKGWRQGDGAAVGEARGPYEAPPAALIQRVAATMGAAVAKYELPAFIERQRRGKKPPSAMAALAAPLAPQQAAVSGAAAAAAVGPGGLRFLAGHAHRPSAAQPQRSNHPSPAETLSIGVTAPATAGAAATTTAAQRQPHQHSAGGGSSSNSMPSGCADGDDSDVEIVGETATAAATADTGGGNGGARQRGRGKAKGSSARKRSRGSAGGAGGGGGNGGAAATMESRLRAYLLPQGVSKLRRRNASEGVGWTLLDLAEADRDVRLQRGCDGLDAGEVVDRLLQTKLPPGKQLSPLAIQAVSMSVCQAHDKFKLGVFVAAEVNKRLKRRRRRGQAGGDNGGAGGGGGAGGYIEVS